MKKVILIITIAFFGFKSVQAQEEGTRFGAKAGLNLTKVVGDEVSGLKSKVSFHIGVLAEIPLSAKFAFQPELLYSSQGYKVETVLLQSAIKLDYLNVPLMAKFYVLKGFSLQAGPQIGILLSAKSKTKITGIATLLDSKPIDFEGDIKDIVSKIDFGLNFGAGYQLEWGVFFEMRYNMGLSEINRKNDLINRLTETSVRNAVIQLSIGYKF